MTPDEIKEAARSAVTAAESYLAGKLDFDGLHAAAQQCSVTIEGAGRMFRPAQDLSFLLLSMERTSERGGTHEVRWRNVMQAMTWVVKMHLGEGLHPEDGKPFADPAPARKPTLGWSDQTGLLLTVARILRATLRGMAPNAEGTACPIGDDIAALNEALAPFDGAPSGTDSARALNQALAVVNGQHDPEETRG